MKWTWKSLYLCWLQANLFKSWQRFGNILGITHWITEYFNKRKTLLIFRYGNWTSARSFYAYFCFFFLDAFFSSFSISWNSLASISLTACEGTLPQCPEVSSSGYLYRHWSYSSLLISPRSSLADCSCHAWNILNMEE